MIVYKITGTRKPRFELAVNLDLPGKYKTFSKTFEFDYREPEKLSLFLIGETHVGSLYLTDPSQPMFSVVYTFSNFLKDQPDFVEFNETQKTCIVASYRDALWLKLDQSNQMEIDLDDRYKINEIKCLHFHNGKFYILANKLMNKLGYYLLEVESQAESVFHL